MLLHAVRAAITATAEILVVFYNNNNEDNVYGAVTMTHIIARVHPVHVMNAEQHQMAAKLWTKPTDEP